MSKLSTKATFRRRDTASANPTTGDTLTPEPQSPTKEPARLLRRWSVADLIAQAAARPPATGACA